MTTVRKFSISAMQDIKDYLDSLGAITDIDIHVDESEVVITYT